MRDQEHTRLLDHPMVEAYTALLAFGSLSNPLDAAISEAERRTTAGARVLVLGASHLDKVLALARGLPDRRYRVVDPDDRRSADLTRAWPQGAGNLERGDGPLAFGPEGGFDLAVSFHALHRWPDATALWSALRTALRPGAEVLVQDYVGPNQLAWTEAECAAANAALDEIVPNELKAHHDAVTPDLAARLRAGCAIDAPSAADTRAACAAAGFEIAGEASCGGSLLLPVLLGQSDAYRPTQWQHNAVLGRLFEREQQLIQAGTLAHHFAMFVAIAPR